MTFQINSPTAIGLTPPSPSLSNGIPLHASIISLPGATPWATYLRVGLVLGTTLVPLSLSPALSPARSRARIRKCSDMKYVYSLPFSYTFLLLAVTAPASPSLSRFLGPTSTLKMWKREDQEEDRWSEQI
jgi:hypothetical protein